MDLKEKIKEFSTPEPNTGCWLWTRGCSKAGYGHLWVDGKQQGAHRWSYEAFNGAITDDQMVLHKCDTRPCVNPEHLWLGYHRDNTHDMLNKNRNPFMLKKTHCVWGHPLNDNTVYWGKKKNGLPIRVCKICADRRTKEYEKTYVRKKRVKHGQLP